MISIRPIQPTDNPHIALIIRRALEEFGANHPGTVYFDASTDSLFELFRQEGSAYFIALDEGQVLGGGGIFPTEGLLADTCELVKMYLAPAARGRGLGRLIMENCIATARSMGYKRVYLETMPELRSALRVYEKMGFQYLEGPMGNSGHTGCSLWMARSIDEDIIA